MLCQPMDRTTIALADLVAPGLPTQKIETMLRPRRAITGGPSRRRPARRRTPAQAGMLCRDPHVSDSSSIAALVPGARSTWIRDGGVRVGSRCRRTVRRETMQIVSNSSDAGGRTASASERQVHGRLLRAPRFAFLRAASRPRSTASELQGAPIPASGSSRSSGRTLEIAQVTLAACSAWRRAQTTSP